MVPESTVPASSDGNSADVDVDDIPGEIAEWPSSQTIAWFAVEANRTDECELWRLPDDASTGATFT